MANPRMKRMKFGRWATVLVVGMLAGSIMLTPVGAHITTFNHLKTKHFYTKQAAEARFIDGAEGNAAFVNSDEPAGGVLAGTYPNPSLGASINKLVPVALIRISSSGGIIAEAHRPPVTGPPVVVHTMGQGDYTMTFPGFAFAASDLAICQLDGNILSASGEIRAGASFGDGSLFVGTATPGGTVADKAFGCAIYDL